MSLAGGESAPRIMIFHFMSRVVVFAALLLGCLLSASVSTLNAQVPAPATVSASAATSKHRLIFPNAPVADLIAKYEELTGKHVIADNSVQGPVNLVINQELPSDEALRILEITLLFNGFHLVQSETDPKIVKATGTSQPPRRAGLKILVDPQELPPGEEVVMYLMKVKFADVQELASILQNAMPPSRQEYAPTVVALPKAQSLLLTENTAILRGLIRLVKEADVKPAEVVSEFVGLERADAKEVVEKLKELFENKQGGTPTTAPRPAAPAVANAAGAAPGTAVAAAGPASIEISGLSEDSIIVGKVRLTADIRTNRIHVISRPANMEFLRGLIRDYDEDAKFGAPWSRELKYVSAGDILPALVQAISDPGSKDQGGAQGTRPGTTPTPTNSFSSLNNGGGSTLGGNRNGAGRSSGTLSQQLRTEERDIVPETRLVGNARIVADKRRNAIIVIGSGEVKDKVAKILDELDVRAPMVMLKTIIGELTLSDDESSGTNYLLGSGLKTKANSNGTLVTDSNGQLKMNLVDLLADPKFTKALNAGNGGISGFVTAGNAMTAILSALESTRKFRVRSSPSVFTSNNKKATISSGEEVAVPTNIQSGIGATAGNSLVTNSSISYKEIALTLEVMPLINSDKEVFLDIVQVVAERSGDTLIDNNRIPTIASRTLQTSVMVPNEGTLVLGGLIKESNDKNVSGVPILQHIPLIGRAFQSSSIVKKRTELVIIIKPVVTYGNAEALGVRDDVVKGLDLTGPPEKPLFPGNLSETPMPPELAPVSRNGVNRDASSAPAKPFLSPKERSGGNTR